MCGTNTEGDIHAHTKPAAPSRQTSYIGFEYQILATVWIGLHITTTGKADAITVEPPESQEDVELDLNVPVEDAESGVRIEQIEIQIKYRSAPVWKSKEFGALLNPKTKKGKKGPSPRVRPLEYLQTEKTRQYILLTNASTEPTLEVFHIKDIGNPSAANRIPSGKKNQPDLAPRIGVLTNRTEEILIDKIEKILQRKCHVPGVKLDSCLQALMSDVRERLKGKVAGRFSKTEIFNRIREHGGKFEQPREPAQPKNYANFTDLLTKQHALIIIGPPGTGKTTLADALVSKLEMHDPPFERREVYDASGISEVRRLLKEPDNHVFYFIDPWGRYTTNDDASTFTSELPKLLTKAQPGKVFIVTSPKGVFSDAVGANTSDFDPFIEHLTGDDYDKEAYRSIYALGIENWSPALRKEGRRWQDEALKRIMTPLAVGTFCKALLKRLESKGIIDATTVKEMADNSNVEHTSRVIRDTFKDSDPADIMSVIAIWAHLAVSQLKITAQDAKTLRDLLRTGGLAVPPDVEQIFNQLVDAGWLKPRSSENIAHATVLQALSQFESIKPGLFEDTIAALFRGWLRTGKQTNILSCIKASKRGLDIVPAELKESVDASFIDIAKASEDYHFTYALNEIKKYCSPQHPISVLARLLTQVEPLPSGAPRFYGLTPPKWMKPSLAASEIDQLKMDSAWFVEKFVTEYLLHETRSFHGTAYAPQELIDFLSQFGWPIREWFNTAFENSLRWSEGSAGFLTDCICLIDALSLDRIFDICLKTYQEIRDRPYTYDPENYRKEEQGEIDASRCDDYDDSEFCIAQSALANVLFHKIKREGYTWIISHPAVKYLLKPWSGLLNGKEDPNELSAFITCCVQNGAIDDIYNFLWNITDTTLGPIVAKLILKQTEFSHGAYNVAENYANLPEFLTTIGNESKKLPIEHRTLVGLRLMSSRIGTIDIILSHLLPDDEQRIVRACYSAKFKGDQDTPEGQTARALLIYLVYKWPDDAAISAIAVLQRMGTDISQWIERFTSSKDSDTRARAWRLCVDKARLLSQGLADEDCGCRVASLENLADHATYEDQLHLIALATDKSAYVRKALAACIGNRQWAHGVPPLIGLLRDKREFGTQEHADDYRIFEVARAACNALNKFPQLPETALDSIRSFLGECTKASVDTTVHGLLFRILSKYPSKDIMRFCSLYIKRFWLRSKWRENEGRDLLVQCLHSIIEMLLSTPALATYLDITNVEEIAGWDAEDDDLVGAALTVIGVTAEHHEQSIDPLAKKDSFTPDRARLLLAASEFLQKKRRALITQYLASEEPFMKLLDWATTMNRQPPYAEFCTANPSVAAWVDTLKNKKAGVPTYERWAISRLIGTPAVPGASPCYDLPHPFPFTTS